MAIEATTRKVMATLLTAYPARHYSTEEMETISAVWLDVLSDVPDDALKAAANEYLRSAAQFAPAPGQLRFRAIELLNGDVKAVAEDAWFKIAESRYGLDPIDDPLVIKAVQLLGGFDEIGNTAMDKMVFARDRFIQHYSELAGRERARQNFPTLNAGNALKQLKGANDETNMAQ